MHRVLSIQEVLFNIFAHCPSSSKEILAALARTCRAFKEPALDLIWEELHDLTPLARCLPDAYYTSEGCYSFSRQLTEFEWNTLRGYTRRVRRISYPSGPFPTGALSPGAARLIFTLAPFTDPLFPNLRSLSWRDTTILPVVHAVVPSLTTLHLTFASLPEGHCSVMEFLEAIGKRCRYMKDVKITKRISTGPLDVAVSRQVCRWNNLRILSCTGVTLNMDAVSHLATLSSLSYLSFTLGFDSSADHSHFSSILVFNPNLAMLHITSASLKPVTQFFSRIRLPGTTSLKVNFTNDAWKQDVQAYWAAVERACSSNTIRCLELRCNMGEATKIVGLEEQMCLQLTLDDLPFYKTLNDLHEISIDIPWSVKLTDADLLNLIHKSLDLTRLSINTDWGWRPDGGGEGVTLDGLAQILKCCPSLECLDLAIDTQTFINIPEELEVSIPPDMSLNLLDSHITPDLVAGLASGFTALELDPWSFETGILWAREPEEEELDSSLWDSVRRAMC